MAEANIYAGQWGHTHRIIVKDQDDAIRDVSAVTAKIIVFRSPGNVEYEKTAEFTDDGTDGEVEYVVTDGDTVDATAGVWRRWAVLTFGTDGKFPSTPEAYQVYRAGTE